MYKSSICENVNATAKFNVTYEIKRDLYYKNDPTNVKQFSKNLKLIKIILRKRKLFFLVFIYFLKFIFYFWN
jgi:hypothetical protein